MFDAAVEGRVTLDAGLAVGEIGGLHETNRRRALNLVIDEAPGGFNLSVLTDDSVLAAAFGDLLGRKPLIPLTQQALAVQVQLCRQAWRLNVVDRIVDGARVFERDWDLSGRPELLAAALPKLAEAGTRLFVSIFSQGFGEDAATLREIGIALRRVMSTESLWLKVTSSSFFAPWGLIYSDALDLDGSNASLTGFWGYQHVVEHIPANGDRMGQEPAHSLPVRLGVQFDQSLDRDLGVPCLAPVLGLFDTYTAEALARADRPLRADLRAALTQGPRNDQILYFCCHGQQEGDEPSTQDAQNYLILSEQPRTEPGIRITPGDIEFWVDLNTLEAHPLVFINACGGGQMNSLFYQAFGTTFLRMGACAVIGPQVDVPAVFAGEFARRFFERLFLGGPNNQLGAIMFDVRREFASLHANPLGLIYSLYRGADVYLPPLA